jgi:hypothetical protein
MTGLNSGATLRMQVIEKRRTVAFRIDESPGPLVARESDVKEPARAFRIAQIA